MAITQVNLCYPQLITGEFCWSSFAVGVPMLAAISVFGLGSSPQWCYLHRLRTILSPYHIKSDDKVAIFTELIKVSRPTRHRINL